MEDVSEHKRSDDALAESQALLSALINSTNDMIWSVDPMHYGLLTFNHALRDYFLQEHHIEIRIGMPPEDMLPPAFAAKWHALYQRALREGSFVEEYLVSSGLHILQLTFSPLLRNGETIGISVFGKEVTEHRRAEEALAQRLRFEQLLADLSSRFTNLPSEQVDQEIVSGLNEVREFLDVELVGFMEVSPDHAQVRLTHFGREESNALPLPPGTDLVPHLPWLYKQVVLKREVFCMNSSAELPPEASVDLETHRQLGVDAFLSIPLLMGGTLDHIIGVSCQHPRIWPQEYIPRLRMLGEVFVNALARKRSDEIHKQNFQEIKDLKDRLQVEAEYLRAEIVISQGHGEIIGRSQSIQQVLKQIEQVAPTDSHVLITGETGTGKELVARAIHAQSQRKDRLMVTVNCATLPASLIESELFGREKGAYTGAMTRQIGRFELADGGTIFLDEIGELSLELQSKLLRVLQQGEFERLGGPSKTIKVNVRIIAATNKNLAEAVRQGEYRKDLYYRLSVFPIEVPPLRERAEDIPLLTWAFIDEFSKNMGKKIESVSQKTMELLKGYSWPGNVRELRNIIERAMILSHGSRLEVQLPKTQEAESPVMLTLEEAERRHILNALQKSGWRVKGPQGAAALLHINPSTLGSRMDKLGIPHRPQKDDISS
ncbi:sigma 54-interacting transcriptional regulator [bacterium]|nr:sigma 54-interacting transcriptional regulator [bacterium]